MNLPNNLGKSTLLACIIFWSILALEISDSQMLPYFLLMVIPIFICVTIVIVCTICPVFWLLQKDSLDKIRIFKTFFPYYAICAFGICAFGIISTNFEIFVTAFFTAAYVTTCQSWVWFTKETS